MLSLCHQGLPCCGCCQSTSQKQQLKQCIGVKTIKQVLAYADKHQIDKLSGRVVNSFLSLQYAVECVGLQENEDKPKYIVYTPIHSVIEP
uniref:Uncharacterized protein n=1 Tax=Megaselia scalaris TaxID=36166 RepID=T1GRF9_MEGSC